ncbi:MAG TPA: ABC transporter substrate-binding protein [Rhizomicrobium sp.]|nr:ABC transporter substrate-binding protein [Rhizomicrobium sp.]
MPNKLANLSLTSLCFTALAAAIHHMQEMGSRGAAIAVIFLLAGYGCLIWFKHTASRASLIFYALLNVWLVVGFGLFHGVMNHAVALVSALHAGAPLETATIARDLTALVMILGAGWTAFAGWRFLAAVADARTEAAAVRQRLPSAPAIVATAVLGAFIGINAYANANAIRIALFAPTSGPQAVLTRAFVAAAELAKEDLGPAGARLELVVIDTSGTPQQAQRVIDQAFATQRFDAVLGAVSTSGQFTAPHARETRIPHICVCSIRTIGDGQYNFTNIPLPEDEAARWVAEAKRRGVTSIAVLTQEETSVRNHANAAVRKAMRNGIRILFDGRFVGEGTDFDLLAQEARAVNADLVLMEAFPPIIDKMMEALRRRGVNNVASIVAPSAVQDPRGFEGVWYTDTNLADENFERRFRIRFPQTRFAAHMTPYAYDSFKLLARALSSGQEPAAYLRGVTRYEGAAGLVTREAGSGNFRSRPAVWTIENGRPRLLTP